MGKLGYSKKAKSPVSQLMVVDSAGTPERLGGFYTASTISFDNASSEIRDSASLFLSKMFRAGIRISVTGTTLNDGQYTIVTATAGVLTVSETVTDEAAGASTALASLNRTFCKNLIVQALGSNTDNIAVGGSNVDLSANVGEVLVPYGTSSDDAIHIEDVYIDSAVNGEGVCVTFEETITLS